MGPLEGVEEIGARRADAGFSQQRVKLAGHDALVARRSDFRWEWVATRLHTFVMAFHVPELDEQLAEDLTAAAQQYAIKHKGGLPRGLQTGSAAVPVFLSREPHPALHPWFSAEPRHRFAALRFPVLVELDAPTLTYFQGRAQKGGVYLGHLRRVVRATVDPAVQTVS